MMYHPSHHVPDLAAAERFFEEVFDRASTSLASMARGAPPRPGYPNDYSTFTPISDVLFDTIDPKRYVLLGVQRYATVEQPHLKAFGWYFEGMAEVYRELTRRGIRVTSQLDEIADGDDPPTAAGSPMPPYFYCLRMPVCGTSSFQRYRSPWTPGLSRVGLCRRYQATIPWESSAARTTPC
jgi:hypothetical protein